MGRQGYLTIAIILGTAAFAASRSGDWTSLLVSALLPPLVLFPLIFALSRRWQGGAQVRDRRGGPRQRFDLMTFLARTNPVMFLLFGILSGRSDDDRYRRLLRSGPYGKGQQGYFIALILILTPLILTLIIVAVTGHQPMHIGPHHP
jgi:hypothetical protein